MLEPDLEKLLRQAPDHDLGRLEGDIWADVRGQEHAALATRRLLLVQAVILVAGLIGGLLAGERSAGQRHASTLEVFSAHMPLSSPTLLLGNGS